MKRIFLGLLVALMGLSACTDSIYEDINTDPTKSDKANPSAQLTYAELETYGEMGVVDMYRLYIYAFNQQLMGCWNTTQYGGCNRADDTEMPRMWKAFYTNGLNNLTDAIHNTKDDPAKINVNSALRIYRVYMMSLITDIYGDAPYSEACLGFITGNTAPKYDTQKDMYIDFFKELKDAQSKFDATQEKITSDVIYGGTLDNWKRFANSLRLRYAMRISDVDPDLAKQEFEAALADGVFTNASQDALIKYANISFSFAESAGTDFRGNALSKYFYGNDPANNPSYICSVFWEQLVNNNDPRTNMYCRFYLDDWMSVTSPDGRVDMTDAMMADRAAGRDYVSLDRPGEFSWDDWPSYGATSDSYLAARVAEVQALHAGWDPGSNPRWLKPKLATNFLKSDNPGVVMTYAEVQLLMAEAAVKGWTVGSSAKDLYESGIRAAMDFISTNYGFSKVSDADLAAYLAQPAIAFGSTAEQQKSQINTQAWILHFNNPAECWANLRRADFPQLKSPATYQTKNPMIDGDDIPVRLLYPAKEASYNGANYNEAIGRVEGGYNWHARLWWDVK